MEEYRELMDEVAALYQGLLRRQQKVMLAKTEEVAVKTRKATLGYVTEGLYRILKIREDPRVE